MNFIEEIKKPIANAFSEFEEQFLMALHTENPLLKKVTDFVVQTRGKQMRPILVMLSAQISGSIKQETIYSAVSLEILHAASLIHDDVLDESMERRGKQSINAAFQNKIAILAGDFYLSKSLQKVAHTQNIQIIEVVSQLGAMLAEGEFLELANAKHVYIDEKTYFEIIKDKTAILFSSCSQIGALSVGASPEVVEKLRLFGEYIGNCFQIRDDIFDYFSAEIGKPTGSDLREGKLTLPLIFAIDNATKEEKEQVLRLVEKTSLEEEEISFLQEFAVNKGGIEYAETKMAYYKNLALGQIASFPASATKNALVYYADYVVNRVS